MIRAAAQEKEVEIIKVFSISLMEKSTLEKSEERKRINGLERMQIEINCI